MRIWKFIPLLQPGDPDWLGHNCWTEVIVRATTAGEALETAELELEGISDGVGNESPGGSSGLANKRLYQMVSIDEADLDHNLDLAAVDGPVVLKATRASDSPAGTHRADVDRS